ncbi:MAG: hypothetical protein H7123_00560 [Thermoleophilia bacterium]|nr:hypothetical protein [Thermoleophilia bacterium]
MKRNTHHVPSAPRPRRNTSSLSRTWLAVVVVAAGTALVLALSLGYLSENPADRTKTAPTSVYMTTP